MKINLTPSQQQLHLAEVSHDPLMRGLADKTPSEIEQWVTESSLTDRELIVLLSKAISYINKKES